MSSGMGPLKPICSHPSLASPMHSMLAFLWFLRYAGQIPLQAVALYVSIA